MLDRLKSFHDESLELGYSGSRVIGEMSPKVPGGAGGERLGEYEARVTLLQRERPVTTVCQYDVNHFDGATIMEILRVHPLMIIRGQILSNPFHIEPELYLRQHGG